MYGHHRNYQFLEAAAPGPKQETAWVSRKLRNWRRATGPCGQLGTRPQPQGREDHEEDAEATASAFMPIVAAATAYSDSDIGDGDDSNIDDPLPLFRRGRNNVLLSDSE